MSTYASLHYHITFSTKHRAPLIDQTWEKRLHEYLGGTVKHHRVKSYRDELMEMLERASVEYDPKYL